MDKFLFFSSDELGIKKEDPAFMARFEERLRREPKPVVSEASRRGELVQALAAATAAGSLLWGLNPFVSLGSFSENLFWILGAGIFALAVIFQPTLSGWLVSVEEG